MLNFMTFDYLILLRLVFAVIFGGIIGFERGGTNHEAGLRTHIILCLGAASVMVLSECIALQYGILNEIMRMSAQVISGVGFLGVGSIIIDGNKIRGVTTAAGLWTTACVGLVVGAGYYIIAIFIVALMLFTMLGLRSMTKKLKNKTTRLSMALELSAYDALSAVLTRIDEIGASAKSVKVDNDDDIISVNLEIQVNNGIIKNTVIGEISSIDAVDKVTCLY